MTRALIVANFPAAVALCFQHGRDADGLMLSSLGGVELVKRAQRAFMDRQTPKRRIMRLAEAIRNDDIYGILKEADLSKPGMWKQTLAQLFTIARAEDFAAVCDALGQRIENETTGT